MKLLYCPACGDMFSLRYLKDRSCECGEVSGKYINRSQAEVNGKGYSIGIGNESLDAAILSVYLNNERGVVTDRSQWMNNNVITCWARPHDGPGNPHTKINGEDK